MGGTGLGRRVAVGVLAALLLAGSVPAALPAVDGAAPETFKLRSGRLVKTHGFDGVASMAGPAPLAAAQDAFVATTPRPPTCVASGTWDHHGLLVYARPVDKPDRYTTLLPTLRAAFNLANGKLRQEAEEFGVVASYRMRCASGGVAEVARATLPTPSGQTDFHTILEDLEALGYASPRAKYWVVYDTGYGTVGGQATLETDDRLLADNENNEGASYAVTYGCAVGQEALCALVFLHESAHNLGAVQDSAPHSTGAGHCNDEDDVLCYDDGGPFADPFRACSDREHFDCKHDDYFHPRPANGSYLATHWNLGSPLNRYIRFPALAKKPGPPQSVVALPGVAVDAGWLKHTTPVRLSWEAPTDDGDAPIVNYRIYRSDGGPFQPIGQVGDARSFEDPAFPATGVFTYQVRAINNAGEGAATNVTVSAVRWP